MIGYVFERMIVDVFIPALTGAPHRARTRINEDFYEACDKFAPFKTAFDKYIFLFFLKTGTVCRHARERCLQCFVVQFTVANACCCMSYFFVTDDAEFRSFDGVRVFLLCT